MRSRTRLLAVLLAAGLLAGLARGETIQSAGGGFWDSTNTWSTKTVPTSADDVTILNGHTITNRDLIVRQAGSLTIQAGGVLTHSPHASDDTTEKYKVILNVVSNLTVEAGGSINVDGMGYYRSKGPGAANAGGHGGRGGLYQVPQTPGTTYGSIPSPTNCGSGGMNSSGGGAIILTVGNAAVINGMLTAVGGPVSGYYAGSGGSIFLTAKTISGTGTNRVDGGSTTSDASGGGGRIAVVLTGSDDFGSVAMTAYGGTAANGPGAAGTIYLEHTNHAAGRGKLIVDNGSRVPLDRFKSSTLQNGTAASAYSFSEIVLTNGAWYMLDANDALDITNTVVRGSPVNRFDGIYVDGGTLGVPPAFSFTEYFIGIGANSTFNPTGSLTVGNRATLIADKPHTLNCPVTIASGGLVSNLENGERVSYAEANKVNLTIRGNLDVQSDGEINVDTVGFFKGYGPGTGAAGAHGGQGGVYADGQAIGMTYGSITAPTNCGSGGSSSGGSGGGAVLLAVAGTTTVNGVITASGGGSAHYQGSGGSIFLTTGEWAGNGMVKANGGWKDSDGACAGGGRIAVILTNSTDFGAVRLQAYGGYSSTLINRGSAGTIYLRHMNQAPDEGFLLVDNSNRTTEAFSTTLISDKVTDRIVGTVCVTNTGKMRIATNQSLTVKGDWLNAGIFIGTNTGASLILGGANSATVRANNAFYNLTCTEPGKTLTFEAGRTNTVNGLLTLGSASSEPTVTLQSTIPGSWTYLTLAEGGAQQLGKVSVKDSNASGGQALLAGKGSSDGGHNVNWQFPSGGTVLYIW